MIESLINQIAGAISPSSGGNLHGFVQELDYALWQAKDVITSGKTLITNDPRRLIIVTASIAENVNVLPEVFHGLKKIWLAITYNYFEASSCECYKEAVILRFVTTMSDKQFFVTGAIVLQGEKYQKLILEHQQKLDQTYDLLPSIASFEELS